MPKTTPKKRADQIIRSMQRLPQSVAAWLVNLSPRALRDHATCPRNDDGTYDAKAVAAWSVGRRELAELTDEEIEKCYCISDLLHEASYDLSGSVVRAIRDLEAKYGDRALATFAAVFMERWSWTVDHHPEDWRPASSEARREWARRNEEIKREGTERDEATADLRVAFVCDGCGKLRRGRRWIDEEPPAGHIVTDDICPTCTTTQG